jgi:hypothetical protein
MAQLAPLPAQKAPDLVVLVRDPSGVPVEAAAGTLLCEPAHTLPALAGLSRRLRDPILGSIATLGGTSDGRGVLRFEAPADARSGAGIVTTEQGLGALLPQLLPGRAQRITLQPMGDVTTAPGSEAFTLWARAHVPPFGSFDLPPMHGAHARLPAGSYEVWAHNDDGWTWQRIEVVSARPTLLQFTGPAQRLRSSAELHPSDWPALRLCEPGDDTTLLGAAIGARLTAVDAERDLLAAERMLPLPPSRHALPWPPAEDAGERTTFALADGAPANGVAMFSVRRTASETWQLLGVSLPDADRRFHLPDPGEGDTWLLLAGADCAPIGRPWSTTPPASEWSLERGVPLVVVANDRLGDPAVDVLVEYVPEGSEVASVRARADGYGTARLGRALGPGTVRLSDPRFANREFPIEHVPVDGLHVEVSEGLRIAGTVVLDTAPGTREVAAGVVITLRDPSGSLRPAERAVVTGEDGSFRFEGLAEDSLLVLFASVVRDGHTWSGRAANVIPGRGPIDVVLRDEDPQPPRDDR